MRFLLHDRDGKLAASVDTVLASADIEVITTLAQAPHADAVAERVVRTIRAACRDQLLILNRRHLTVVIRQDLADDTHCRPPQALRQALPFPLVPVPAAPAGPERGNCRPILGGIIPDDAVAT